MAARHSRPIGQPVAADQQANHLRAIASGYFGDMAHILGGDFNRRPCVGAGVGGVYDYYNSYHEGDEYYTRRVCDPPGRYTFYPRDGGQPTKIDYVWSRKLTTAGLYGVADIECGPPSTGSDHCYYRATFQWP